MVGAFLWPGASAADGLQRASRHLFGSPIEVLIRPHRSTAGDAASAMAQVLSGLQRLNRDWNAWKPGELGRLNQALREGRRHEVTRELVTLVRLAATIESRSAGLFNAAIGGLVGAWGFHDDVLRPGTRPAPEVLAHWGRPMPSLAALQIDGVRVASGDPRVQLDFGAIAKGWAIDRALDHLERHGWAHAVVDLGGNLATMGRADQRPWQIGIRDPLDGGVLARVATTQREAVVTSGNYERFRLIDGQRMSHIIDPRQGEPAQGLLSVTVLHASAAIADAAATALMVAGPLRWPFVADRLNVRQVLVVQSDGRCVVTAGLAGRLAFTDPRWMYRTRVVV